MSRRSKFTPDTLTRSSLDHKLADFGGMHGLTVKHVAPDHARDTRPNPKSISILPAGYEAERYASKPNLYHNFQHGDGAVLCRAVYRIHMTPEMYPHAQRELIDETFLEFLDSRPGTRSFDCDECRTAVLVTPPKAGTTHASVAERAGLWTYLFAQHNATHSRKHDTEES